MLSLLTVPLLWELQGLNCPERAGKEMDFFFYFSFFLIFSYFAGSLSTEQSLSAGQLPHVVA